jgi:putative membrane protein
LELDMTDLLAVSYLWIKALHIMAVISWMAGLFYLPRLFVYHVEQAGTAPAMQPIFAMMEEKLLRVIMNPAMIATWVFGLALVFTPGIVDWGSVWPWTKGAAVLGMTWFHHWVGRRRKDFLSGKNALTGRHYRMMNEVPTLLMVVIVFSVILKF